MTNNHNPYITEKVVMKRKRNTAIVIICGFLAISTILATHSSYLEGEYDTVIIELILLALFVLPIIRISLHKYYSICAKRIAEDLLPLTDDRIPFHKLGETLSLKNPLLKLKRLIGKGYLQNMHIDQKTTSLLLNKPNESYIDWVCDGCGAKNLIKKGVKMYCNYCGQPHVERIQK
ncbi:MAG: hypothetical protein Q4E07_02955 [Eubacteriales bacterium]|nr:hypothetical protein [Eubacteriales bacterium]